MTTNQSEALSSLCIILVNLNRPLRLIDRVSMLDQCKVVFAGADMIQHLMPRWQRGKRKNKWRVLLFQRLDLAFFPSCETSESQV